MTSAVPIVMVFVNDPVADGLVAIAEGQHKHLPVAISRQIEATGLSNSALVVELLSDLWERREGRSRTRRPPSVL